ncbi:hypothetical protein HK102_005151, partial [Quaeritorhiza haematococci]
MPTESKLNTTKHSPSSPFSETANLVTSPSSDSDSDSDSPASSRPRRTAVKPKKSKSNSSPPRTPPHRILLSLLPRRYLLAGISWKLIFIVSALLVGLVLVWFCSLVASPLEELTTSNNNVRKGQPYSDSENSGKNDFLAPPNEHQSKSYSNEQDPHSHPEQSHTEPHLPDNPPISESDSHVMSSAPTTQDISTLSTTFSTLRAQKGHFSGSQFNPSVDAYDGEKHRTMKALGELLGKVGTPGNRVIQAMGPPDEIVARVDGGGIEGE